MQCSLRWAILRIPGQEVEVVPPDASDPAASHFGGEGFHWLLVSRIGFTGESYSTARCKAQVLFF